MIKRFGCIVLCLCLVALAACSSAPAPQSSSEAAPVESAPQPAESPEESASIEEDSNKSATRIIVDQMGNEVEIPEKIERVAIASVWPLASVYCLYMGSSEKLVGLDPAIISAAENSMLIKVAPDIVNIPSAFIVSGDMNAEELLKLEPDVVLYASGVPADYEIATQAGIPAIGFSLSIKDYNAVETINTWIELLGEIMQQDFDTAEFMAYGTQVQEMVAGRLAAVAEEDRPRGMFIHLYDDSNIGVPSDKSWAQYWLTAGGATNVAGATAEGTLSASMEQIYEWNPEVIFITNFNPGQPDDLYNNTVGNYDWSGVAAVQNKRVYKMPLGMYRWYVCNSDSPLAVLWMAKQIHPALFEDIDMDQTITEYYKQFYDLELTAEDLAQIYAPSSAAAAGI